MFFLFHAIVLIFIHFFQSCLYLVSRRDNKEHVKTNYGHAEQIEKYNLCLIYTLMSHYYLMLG